MLGVTERKKGAMNSISEHHEPVLVAVQLDRLFSAFEIEMSPDQALLFAKYVDASNLPETQGLLSVIGEINRVIPPANFGVGHAKTGQPHHHYRVGRYRGQRLLKIEIFKGFFQLDYDFMTLMETLHAIGTKAAAHVAIEADNNSYSIVMRWSAENLAPPPNTGGFTA